MKDKGIVASLLFWSLTRDWIILVYESMTRMVGVGKIRRSKREICQTKRRRGADTLCRV